jgi:hypothetical protein
MTDDPEAEATRRRRSVVRIGRLAEQGEERDLDGTTAEERFAMMWRLALDAWAFMGQPVEPRLSRRIVRIHRR